MDTNLKPAISIVTITKDRGDFIAKAIESVLRQHFSDWELIVLDDDSHDGTRHIVEQYAAKDARIRYYANSPALGISKNRNRGLSLSNGTYIAVLDSDDTWTDHDKLKKQYDFLEAHREYVLIGSNVDIVDETGALLTYTRFATKDADIRKKILIRNQIAHSSVVYRSEAVKKVGGYDETLSCVEDLDLFLRLGLVGKMKNLDEVTTQYTKHAGGTSYRKKKAMAWNHCMIVLKNFGKYPSWFSAVTIGFVRILRNIF